MKTTTAGIESGITTLYFKNAGMIAYYAKKDAVLSNYKLISQEEMKKIVSSAN